MSSPGQTALTCQACAISLSGLMGSASHRNTPPLVSVIDVAVMITGKSAKTVARDLGALSDRYPEVSQKLRDLKFPDAGQRALGTQHRRCVECVLTSLKWARFWPTSVTRGSGRAAKHKSCIFTSATHLLQPWGRLLTDSRTALVQEAPNLHPWGW